MTFETPHLHEDLAQFAGSWNGSYSSLYSEGYPQYIPSGLDLAYSTHLQSICPPSSPVPLSMPMAMDRLSNADMSFGAMSGMQQPSLPSYPSVGNMQGANDTALVHALQAQLAAMALLNGQNPVAHLGMSGGAVDNLHNISQGFQNQYAEALAQANMQAVVQALLQQKLTVAQQVALLQQLVLKQQDGPTVNAKAKRVNNRNVPGKQRNQSRSNGKKTSPVTGQAPSWAGSNWHPMASVLAKSSKGPKESSGTGVFLPGGNPSASFGDDKSSDSGNSDASGATLHLSMHQEYRC